MHLNKSLWSVFVLGLLLTQACEVQATNPDLIKRAKDESDPFRLMGFGYRVYKNYDPRAKIMRKVCHEVLGTVGHHPDDALFKVALELERIAMHLVALTGLATDIAFLQGGATLQFSMVPMNLLPAGGTADYLETGAWSEKAIKEAQKVGTVHVAASSRATGHDRIPAPAEMRFSAQPAYVHMTSNNTIYGTQWQIDPEPPPGEERGGLQVLRVGRELRGRGEERLHVGIRHEHVEHQRVRARYYREHTHRADAHAPPQPVPLDLEEERADR